MLTCDGDNFIALCIVSTKSTGRDASFVRFRLAPPCSECFGDISGLTGRCKKGGEFEIIRIAPVAAKKGGNFESLSGAHVCAGKYI
jgi:hypothetical protein